MIRDRVGEDEKGNTLVDLLSLSVYGGRVIHA